MSWVFDEKREKAPLVAETMTMKFHKKHPNFINKKVCFKTGTPKNGDVDYLGIYFYDTSTSSKKEEDSK